MTNTKSQAVVLSIADGAYHAGRGRLVETLQRGERDDKLADFLADQLRKVTEGRGARQGVDAALDVLDSIVDDISTVRYEMDLAMRRLS